MVKDWMTKLVVADEVSAHIEPRKPMAILMNVGKPVQTSDNIFMTEWVAIFRESGLRDDVTIANLQDACLKLVVLARARAPASRACSQPLSAKTAIPTIKPKPKTTTETDKPVCRFFLKPDGCRNGDNSQYARHAPMGSACVVVQNHTTFKPLRSLLAQQCEASAQEALCEAQREDCGGTDFESGIPGQEER